MADPGQQGIQVPTDALLPIVIEQRNNALTEVAGWKVLAQQAMAERDELAAEVERLRTGTPDA